MPKSLDFSIYRRGILSGPIPRQVKTLFIHPLLSLTHLCDFSNKLKFRVLAASDDSLVCCELDKSMITAKVQIPKASLWHKIVIRY